MTDELRDPSEILEANTYYGALGIEEDASVATIKEARFDLIQDYHPDRNEDDNAKEVFKRIQRAYEVLTDPRKRENYDRLGHDEYVQQRKEWGDEDGTIETEQNRTEEREQQRKQKKRRRRRKTKENSSKGHTTNSTKTISTRIRNWWDSTTVEIREQTNTASKAIREPLPEISEDPITNAVAYAWRDRLIATLALIVLIIGGDSLIAYFGFHPSGLPIPEGETIYNHDFALVVVVLLSAFVTFVGDHIRTSMNVERGSINTSTSPRFWHRVFSVSLVCGVFPLSIAVLNGGSPIESMFTGPIVDSLWMSSDTVIGRGVNATLSVMMPLTLVLGIIGIPGFSRHVWYNRYANGYRLIVGVWDAVVVLPLIGYVVTSVSAVKRVPVPEVVSMSPKFSNLLSISGGVATPETFLVLSLLVPPVLGAVYDVRRGIEWAIKFRNRYQN